VRLLIDAQPDMEVVGEAGTAAEAERLAGETGADVLVLDLSMPGGGSISAIERLRAVCPKTRVLVLTMHDDATFVRAALTAGGCGYVVKTSASAGLLTAIRAVFQGGTYMDAGLAGSLVHSAAGTPAAADGGGVPSALTAREKEVLARLAEGYTNQQVAEQLYLSTKTVEAHRARIYQKLGLKTRADLVRYAMEAGLLRPR
jgi:DNA-binding NarL/FixJ family response regulator